MPRATGLGLGAAMTSRRVLLLAATTGYQTRMFEEAARRRGVDLVYATDRCDHLDDPWQDGAIAVRFHDPAGAVAAVRRAAADRPIDGVLAVGDRPAVIAAHVQQALGLSGHPPDAAAIARDKRRLRTCLDAAGMPTTPAWLLGAADQPADLAVRLPYPVVVKPTTLSGSRGVIRADDAPEFAEAVARIRRLLASPDVRVTRDDELGVVQVERYIDGIEYAVEGIVEYGRLRVLAVFDKPDPLVGPYFEETIYVTPSRAAAPVQAALADAVAAAVAAIGLHHGPIHAECRVAADGVYVLEVAARPIGGLCARALRFVPANGPAGERVVAGLEDLLVGHALGESAAHWVREDAASGVMMIPIPRGGVFREMRGLDAARGRPFVDDVIVTAKPGQVLVPLPEGASYLGFIFARAATPAEVEAALREAHAALQVEVASSLPVVG